MLSSGVNTLCFAVNKFCFTAYSAAVCDPKAVMCSHRPKLVSLYWLVVCHFLSGCATNYGNLNSRYSNSIPNDYINAFPSVEYYLSINFKLEQGTKYVARFVVHYEYVNNARAGDSPASTYVFTLVKPSWYYMRANFPRLKSRQPKWLISRVNLMIRDLFAR